MFYYDPSQPENQAPASSEPSYETVPMEVQPPSTPVTQEWPAVAPSSWPAQAAQPGLPAQYIQPGQYAPTAQPGLPAHYAQTSQYTQTAQPAPSQAQRAKRSGSGARSTAIFVLTCVVILIFGVGLFSGWTFANSHTTSNTPTSPSSTSSTSGNSSNALMAESQEEAVIAKVEPSVVQVQGSTSQGESIGSGIIIDSKGDIVTNNHVIEGTSSLEVVLSNGNTEQAQIIGTNSQADLAVIRIQPFANMAVATLGDSSKLTVGQTVVAIGNPLGYSGTATEGVVSALNRSASESNTVTLSGMIQTSAAINPGNSGGALINLQGEVVGITTLTAINTETNTPANGLGFAIPSNQIKTVVAQIVNS
jgi:S1-C subfamily serine protease